MSENTTYTCSRCGASKEAARLPRGWKVLVGDTVCIACLKVGWCIRSITLTVAQIVGRQDGGPTSEPEPVEGFLRHFLPAWRMATDLSNWAIQEIVRRDVRRTPDMQTLPRYESCNLYRTWNQECPVSIRQAWDGAAGSASAVLKRVEDTWKGHPSFGRFAVLWKGQVRPMVFRFPTAFPVRCQEWSGRWIDHPGSRIPVVSVTLPGSRYLLQLDRTPELRRQLCDFSYLLSGEAHPGDLKVVPVQRGGRIVGAKVTLSGRFPRVARDDPQTRVAIIRTSPKVDGAHDTLFVVETPDHEPFYVHAATQLRGAVNAHVKWLRRYREDMKYEKRWPKWKRDEMVAEAKAHLDRFHGRIDSEMKQLCRCAVDFVKRQRCGRLEYDDSDRSFLGMWPWAATRGRTSCICGEEGISFYHLKLSDDADSGAV